MGKETLVKATCTSSLAWDDNQERAVDRMTAIGVAARRNELGAALLRVESLDESALRKVILLVTRRLNHRHRIARGFAEKMAGAILQEFLNPHCPACGGKREIHLDGHPVIACHACSGSGTRRYTDTARCSMVGGGYNKAAYEHGLGYVREAMAGMVSAANQLLE
jgi:hypothetical protein